MAAKEQGNSTDRLLDIIRGKESVPRDRERPAAPPSRESGASPGVDETSVQAAGGEPQARYRLCQRRAFGKHVVAGVDILGDVVRMVKMSHAKGKCRLEGLTSFALDPELDRDSRAFADLLKKHLRSFLGKAKNVQLWSLVPSGQADFWQLRVPRIPPSQLPEAVYWAVKKEKQFEDGKFVLDFEIQREVTEGGTAQLEVMAYLVPREEVDRIRRIFARTGFKLTGLTIAPFAVQTIFRSGWNDSEAVSCANLFVGDEWSRIDIYEQGNLVLNRGIKTGTSSMAESLMDAYNTGSRPRGNDFPSYEGAERHGETVLSIDDEDEFDLDDLSASHHPASESSHSSANEPKPGSGPHLVDEDEAGRQKEHEPFEAARSDREHVPGSQEREPETAEIGFTGELPNTTPSPERGGEGETGEAVDGEIEFSLEMPDTTPRAPRPAEEEDESEGDIEFTPEKPGNKSVGMAMNNDDRVEYVDPQEQDEDDVLSIEDVEIVEVDGDDIEIVPDEPESEPESESDSVSEPEVQEGAGFFAPDGEDDIEFVDSGREPGPDIADEDISFDVEQDEDVEIVSTDPTGEPEAAPAQDAHAFDPSDEDDIEIMAPAAEPHAEDISFAADQEEDIEIVSGDAGPEQEDEPEGGDISFAAADDEDDIEIVAADDEDDIEVVAGGGAEPSDRKGAARAAPGPLLDREAASRVMNCVFFGIDDPAAPRTNLKPDEAFAMMRPAADRLARQVERTLDYYSSILGHDPVQELHFSGDFCANQLFLDYYEKELGIRCAQLDPLNPATTSLQGVSVPASTGERLGYGPATGLALSEDEYTPNLLNTFRDRLREKKRRQTDKIVVAVLMAALLVLAGVYFWQEGVKSDKGARLAAIERQLGEFKPLATEPLMLQVAAEIGAKRRAVKASTGKYEPLALVGEVSRLAPEDVKLMSLSADLGKPATPEKEEGKKKAGRGEGPSRTLSIEGFVTGPEGGREAQLTRFLIGLEESPLFSSVEIVTKGVSSVPTQGGVLGFELMMVVNAAGEAE